MEYNSFSFDLSFAIYFEQIKQTSVSEMSLLVVFSEWLGSKLQEYPEDYIDVVWEFLYSISGKSESLTVRDIICEHTTKNKFFKVYMNHIIAGDELLPLSGDRFQKAMTESVASCDNVDTDLDVLAIKYYIRCTKHFANQTQELKRAFVMISDFILNNCKCEENLEIEQVKFLARKVNLYMDKIYLSRSEDILIFDRIDDLIYTLNKIVKKKCPKQFTGERCKVEHEDFLCCEGLFCGEECPREKFLNKKCWGYGCKINCRSGKFFARKCENNEMFNLQIKYSNFCDVAKVLNFD